MYRWGKSPARNRSAAVDRFLCRVCFSTPSHCRPVMVCFSTPYIIIRRGFFAAIYFLHWPGVIQFGGFALPTALLPGALKHRFLNLVDQLLAFIDLLTSRLLAQLFKLAQRRVQSALKAQPMHLQPLIRPI